MWDFLYYNYYMKPLQDYWHFGDKNITFTWLGEIEIDSVSPVTQAYGFCYDDDGKLLVVDIHLDGRFQVPGGTVEAGETTIDTLQREIIEEANTTIYDIQYLGMQKVENDQDDEIIYQSRYFARIREIGEPKPDPDKGYVLPRKLIDPREYTKVSHWGPIGAELIRLSMEKFRISR
jgi:ADP-ribose pyrophosphatase YjhB (NUDIX family)